MVNLLPKGRRIHLFSKRAKARFSLSKRLFSLPFAWQGAYGLGAVCRPLLYHPSQWEPPGGFGALFHCCGIAVLAPAFIVGEGRLSPPRARQRDYFGRHPFPLFCISWEESYFDAAQRGGIDELQRLALFQRGIPLFSFFYPIPREGTKRRPAAVFLWNRHAGRFCHLKNKFSTRAGGPGRLQRPLANVKSIPIMLRHS